MNTHHWKKYASLILLWKNIGPKIFFSWIKLLPKLICSLGKMLFSPNRSPDQIPGCAFVEKKEQPPINFKTSSFNRLRRRTEYGLAQVQKHFWLGISDFCSSLKEFWRREDTFSRLKVVRCLKMDPKLKGHLFLDALTSLDFKLSLSG